MRSKDDISDYVPTESRSETGLANVHLLCSHISPPAVVGHSIRCMQMAEPSNGHVILFNLAAQMERACPVSHVSSPGSRWLVWSPWKLSRMWRWTRLAHFGRLALFSSQSTPASTLTVIRSSSLPVHLCLPWHIECPVLHLIMFGSLLLLSQL